MTTQQQQKQTNPTTGQGSGFLGLGMPDILQALAGGFDMRQMGSSLMNQAIEKMRNKPAMPVQPVDDFKAPDPFNQIERSSIYPQATYQQLPYTTNGGSNTFGNQNWTSGYF